MGKTIKFMCQLLSQMLEKEQEKKLCRRILAHRRECLENRQNSLWHFKRLDFYRLERARVLCCHGM